MFALKETMSLWTRITEAIEALKNGEPLSEVFERLRTPREQTAGFAIAVIALGAKMAKADGRVTRDEVSAFRRVFIIPPSEEKNAARLFNLARQDVAGFEVYAQRIARMFANRREVLCDLIEGLFHIAMADGDYHPAEDQFLARVAEIFGIENSRFRALRARFVADAERDPYEVLGIPFDADFDVARDAYRTAVREAHPDQMIARGVPEEAIAVAKARMIAINQAWEDIQKVHA